MEFIEKRAVIIAVFEKHNKIDNRLVLRVIHFKIMIGKMHVAVVEHLAIGIDIGGGAVNDNAQNLVFLFEVDFSLVAFKKHKNHEDESRGNSGEEI